MFLGDINQNAIRKFKISLYKAVFTLIGLLAAGTIVFKYIENWTWIDSFYFSVSTISTVGYGDTTPHTELGRLVASFFILIAVPIVLYLFYIFARLYFDQHFFRMEKEEKKVEEELKEK